jgi:GMP synthase-like glutamine amidotransferase
LKESKLNETIRIAILDSVPEVYWADDLGITDAQKFIDLLQPFNPAARFDVFFTSKGQFPGRLDDYDAILVTGSPCSVHDDHDWIARLIELIQEAEDRKLRIIGSCFGHQLVACAFGGDVGHNEKGWVIGNYPVHISRQIDWMQPAMTTTSLYHFNQERVTRLPEDAVAFAHTDDYENYGYTIGDNLLCFQGHPEQPHRAMVNFLSTTDSLSPEVRARAERYIAAGEPDSHIWGEWMMRFYLE